MLLLAGAGRAGACFNQHLNFWLLANREKGTHLAGAITHCSRNQIVSNIAALGSVYTRQCRHCHHLCAVFRRACTRVTLPEGKSTREPGTIVVCVCQLRRKQIPYNSPRFRNMPLGRTLWMLSPSPTANEKQPATRHCCTQSQTSETRPTAQLRKLPAPRVAGAVIRIELSAWKQHQATQRI